MRSDSVTRIAGITLAVCAVLVGLAVLWLLRVPVALCFLSLGVSAALEPAVAWFSARRFPTWWSLSIVYSLLAIFVLCIPPLVALPVGAEFANFAEKFQSVGEPSESTDTPPGILQGWILSGTTALQEHLSEFDSNDRSPMIWQVLGFTWGAFEFLGTLVVIFVLALYWSTNHDHFERLWLSLLSVERRASARELWQSIQVEVGAYLRSEAVQCLLAGALLAFGYHLLGFPFPTLLALTGALAWLVPYAGLLIAFLATFVLAAPEIMVSGDHVLMTVVVPSALYTLAVLGAIELFVEPHYFDRKRYNSLLVLLLVVVLAQTFGITGLLLGPPVAATLQLIGGHFLKKRSVANAATDEYEALEDRIQNVWQIARETEEPAPELLSLLERVTQLSHEVRTI